MDIGFIGLGHMGSGIAANLIEAGHRVTVWNRSPAPAERLAAKGAKRAGAVVETLNGDVVFSMLSNDEAYDETLIASGAIDAARKGLIHVNLATISAALAERLTELHRELGLGYVAAPVLGRPDVAAAGELNVLCAGEMSAVVAVRPLIDSFASQIWELGTEPVRANVVKLACNFALASAIETLGESAALALGYGVEPQKLFEIMTGTFYATPAFRLYADIIAAKRFTPAAFGLPLGFKDVRLALEAGEAKATPLPVASLLRDHFIEAIARGDSDKDWSALAAVPLRNAGIAAYSS